MNIFHALTYGFSIISQKGQQILAIFLNVQWLRIKHGRKKTNKSFSHFILVCELRTADTGLIVFKHIRTLSILTVAETPGTCKGLSNNLQ